MIYDALSKTLKARPVAVERYDGDRIVVARGLFDGDVVVTAGVSKLRDGESVRLTEDDAK